MDNSDTTQDQTNTQTPSDPISSDSSTKAAPLTTPESTISEAPESVSDSVSKDPDSESTKPETPIQLTPALAPKKQPKTLLLLIIFIVLGLAVGGAGGYMIGKNNKPAKVATSNNQTTEKELAIPEGATVIAQCAKNRGIQYALPKDIPLGPVYNVYEGKVIGIEFMVGKDDLLGAAKNYLNLPLSNMRYDHVNIGLLSQGHAGFPLPHYHVDIMMVPTTVTDKITCT